MSISEKLLPEFEREFSSTRKFLALVPDDKLTWKPHPKSMELGRLSWHLSELAERVTQILTQPNRIITPEELPKRKVAWEGKTRELILQRFDAGLASAREAMKSATDADWSASWQLVFVGRTVFDGPRADAYRSIVISHQIHHRAQLGIYLRLNDIAIPGVYGPSADEQ